MTKIMSATDAPACYASSHASACAWAAGYNDAVRDSMASTAAYTNSTTSKAAARKIQPRLSGIRLLVLDAIRKAGDAGLTGWEISKLLDLNLYTAKPRCTELRDAGWIKDSGSTRNNATGGAEIVWIAAR